MSTTSTECIDIKNILIEFAVHAANSQINCITGSIANFIVQSVVFGAQGGICPADLQLLVNTLVAQSNNLVNQIIEDATINVGIIGHANCCN